MKFLRFAFVLFFTTLLGESCSKKGSLPPPPPPPPSPPVVTIQSPPPFGFYIVGYFPNYRNLDEVPDVKFKMCNVINYAFFSVNSGRDNFIKSATIQIMSTPEYQLC